MKGLGPGRDKGKATLRQAVLDHGDAAMRMQQGRAEDAGWRWGGMLFWPHSSCYRASSAMRALQQVN